MNASRERHFLLLEITDPQVSGLLLAIRNIFSGENEWGTNIHLTVRGPVTKPFDRRAVEAWTERIRHDTLRIGNVGVFDNSNEFVVYLEICSKNLRSISYKPHFPKTKVGFNPHLTIYKGRDSFLGYLVKQFLVSENLRLSTTHFRLVPYTSGELPLERVTPPKDERAFQTLIEAGIVRKGILRRGRRLMKQYTALSDEPQALPLFELSLLRAA